MKETTTGGKVLHLTLKKKWFDMIASGEKKEEYREIKQYWINRLTWHEFHNTITDLGTLKEAVFSNSHSVPDCDVLKNRFYNYIEFKNGYSKNAPTITVELNEINIGKAKPEWSDNWKGECFIISLGNIIQPPSIGLM